MSATEWIVRYRALTLPMRLRGDSAVFIYAVPGEPITIFDSEQDAEKAVNRDPQPADLEVVERSSHEEQIRFARRRPGAVQQVLDLFSTKLRKEPD